MQIDREDEPKQTRANTDDNFTNMWTKFTQIFQNTGVCKKEKRKKRLKVISGWAVHEMKIFVFFTPSVPMNTKMLLDLLVYSVIHLNIVVFFPLLFPCRTFWYFPRHTQKAATSKIKLLKVTFLFCFFSSPRPEMISWDKLMFLSVICR